MKVLHVVTVADSLIFLKRRAAWMAERGVTTEVVASPSRKLGEFGREEGVVTHAIELRRAISPLADLVAVTRLVRLIRARRPDVVHAHTPKGGLLGMMAAWVARVPVRIYHIHGLPFETATGIKRRLLTASEWLSCRLATQVLAVSDSILQVARGEGLCSGEKGIVLGAGSINGVDLNQFSPERVAGDARALAEQLGLPVGAQVVGYVGRLVADKGIVTLARAWQQIRVQYPHAVMLVVGDWEDGDPVPTETRQVLESDERVLFTGFMPDPAPAYALMTVLAFPSRREGFGLAAVEASAFSVPVVASRIPGLSDAVADGVSGTLVERDDAAALARAVSAYLANPELAASRGGAGRRRVERKFVPEKIWQLTIRHYGISL